MNEDRELMDFVRDRLEGDVPRDVPRLDEITRFAAEQSFVRAAESRSRSRLWGASLAAACVAAVCAFAVVHVQTASPSPEATVASVIDCVRGGLRSRDAARLAGRAVRKRDLGACVRELGAGTAPLRHIAVFVIASFHFDNRQSGAVVVE